MKLLKQRRIQDLGSHENLREAETEIRGFVTMRNVCGVVGILALVFLGMCLAMFAMCRSAKIDAPVVAVVMVVLASACGILLACCVLGICYFALSLRSVLEGVAVVLEERCGVSGGRSRIVSRQEDRSALMAMIEDFHDFRLFFDESFVRFARVVVDNPDVWCRYDRAARRPSGDMVRARELASQHGALKGCNDPWNVNYRSIEELGLFWGCPGFVSSPVMKAGGGVRHKNANSYSDLYAKVRETTRNAHAGRQDSRRPLASTQSYMAEQSQSPSDSSDVVDGRVKASKGVGSRFKSFVGHVAAKVGVGGLSK